jgi:hypothetical protein
VLLMLRLLLLVPWIDANQPTCCVIPPANSILAWFGLPAVTSACCSGCTIAGCCHVCARAVATSPVPLLAPDADTRWLSILTSISCRRWLLCCWQSNSGVAVVG